jgi:cytochrome c oxidase subunit 2
LADGPQGSHEAIERTESRWAIAMLALLAVMLGVVVVSGVAQALHPPSNVETIDPLTLHLNGEFVESNLGTAREPDGSVTVRLIAQQFGFVPNCVTVPQGTLVRFRVTSPDVIHGLILADTNVNTMVMPGFVAEVRTRFSAVGDYTMPCHEFCGVGHQGMWARVTVVPKDDFPTEPLERTRCVPR